MSWIKPSFLWLMYRSYWGTKAGQEVILALRVKRTFFDKILAQAVPSYYDQDLYLARQASQEAIRLSSVRLQWDPDHDPAGAPLARRAIQLGLRREVLREYAEQAILEIIDLSPFVAAQRVHAESGEYSKLQTPKERVYLPPEPSTVARLQLSCRGEQAQDPSPSPR
jgi:hypothetical protein